MQVIEASKTLCLRTMGIASLSMIRVTSCSTFSALAPGHGVNTLACLGGISGSLRCGIFRYPKNSPQDCAHQQYPGDLAMLYTKPRRIVNLSDHVAVGRSCCCSRNELHHFACGNQCSAGANDPVAHVQAFNGDAIAVITGQSDWLPASLSAIHQNYSELRAILFCSNHGAHGNNGHWFGSHVMQRERGNHARA